MKRAAVILAGGAGTRLRPLSSDENPKQFLKLFAGQSLMQKTFGRLRHALPPDAIYVSTTEQYRDKTLDHLPELPPANVLTEPVRRNTAPAIALCTFTVEKRWGDAPVAFLPADHYIGDEPEFVRVLERAWTFAATADYLVTVGIEPTEPNTGYGYLELGGEIEPGVIRLLRFTEKPSRETAEEFLRSGNFAWNGGMFIWRPEVFRAELQRVAPELVNVTAENYATMPETSIDYALMEKASHVATIRGDFDWSDVGSFEALERAGVVIPDHIKRARD